MINNELSEKDIERIVKERMVISEFNMKKLTSENKSIPINLEEMLSHATGLDITVLEKQHKQTGFDIAKIDIFAIDDFAYNRSKSLDRLNKAVSSREVLQYALRFYLPIEAYTSALDFCMKLYDEKATDWGRKTHLFKLDKTATDSLMENSICTLKEIGDSDTFGVKKVSWNIFVVDFLALSVMSQCSEYTMQELFTDAVRSYIPDRNYSNARRLLKVIQDNQESNLEEYMEGL